MTYELTRETDPDKEIRESLKDLTVKVIVGKGKNTMRNLITTKLRRGRGVERKQDSGFL